MRYAPHALVILTFLAAGPIMFAALAATGFACYTGYVWCAFRLHAPFMALSPLEATKLAAQDVAQYFSFG